MQSNRLCSFNGPFPYFVVAYFVAVDFMVVFWNIVSIMLQLLFAHANRGRNIYMLQIMIYSSSFSIEII